VTGVPGAANRANEVSRGGELTDPQTVGLIEISLGKIHLGGDVTPGGPHRGSARRTVQRDTHGLSRHDREPLEVEVEVLNPGGVDCYAHMTATDHFSSIGPSYGSRASSSTVRSPLMPI